MLRAGADKVAVNTAAVRDPDLLATLRDPVRPAASSSRRCPGPARRARLLGGRGPGGQTPPGWMPSLAAAGGPPGRRRDR